ncbi:MAG: ABC transporter permease [Nanoarchaeota archaeon]
MYKDLVKYALNNIRKRFLRSSLTILSIVVGIMAIYALVSFGQGLSRYMDQTFEDMGTDKLILQIRTFGPPGSGAESFSSEDVNYVEGISGVEVAAGLAFTYAEVRLDEDGRTVAAQSMGLPTEGKRADLAMDLLTVDVIRGRYLRDTDKNKVVLGYNFLEDGKVFDEALDVGDKLLVQGKEVEVIGFIDSLGNPEDDKSVMFEESAFQEFYGIDDEFAMVYIQAQPNTDIDALAERIKEEFRDREGLEEGQEYFSVQTFADIMETSGNVLLTINSIVIIIALISVVVAAINIMNTMYTSVLERTQEIGIMKAIGARNSVILQIFLIESAAQGLLGGALGVGLGYLIARTGGAIATASGYSLLQPYFPLWLTIGSLVFATTIGVVSGMLPAKQASLLKPADSLRYE